MINFDPNPLFFEMVKIFKENVNKDDLLVICNEGGTRSSKTYDFFHFLYMFCDHNNNKGNEIYILRNTLTNCRDYTLKDFKNCMSIIGYPVVIQAEGHKPYCNLFGNHIFFRGLDDEKNQEGYPSDIVFVNEALEIDSASKIAGIRMRCRKAFFMDWNPKFTQHWAFKLEGQANTFFTHSTYKNNRFLKQSIINTIESYCPWHFDDMHLPEEERRPHPVNCATGTADKFRWKVYGEGIRAAQEGVIFNNVRYIEAWPEDVIGVYGQDFGFTNDPSALVKVGEKESDIFLELLLYEPTENSSILSDYYKQIGLKSNSIITADSSDKYTGENKGTVEMVIELQNAGWNVNKVSKTKSVVFWINKMKEKRINIVSNHLIQHAKEEQENYTWKSVNGIPINQPIDKFNHFWDASRYGYISLNEAGFGFV